MDHCGGVLPGFTRDGGSVGGREITLPEPSVRALGECDERKSSELGIPNKSGMRIPSSGNSGSAVSLGSASGVEVESAGA
jgi:hypothetical protein